MLPVWRIPRLFMTKGIDSFGKLEFIKQSSSSFVYTISSYPHPVIRSLFLKHSDAQILYLCRSDCSRQLHFYIVVSHEYVNVDLAWILCKSDLINNSNCLIRLPIPLYRSIPIYQELFLIQSTQKYLIQKDCRNVYSTPQYICRHNPEHLPDRQTNMMIYIAATHFLYNHTIHSYSPHIPHKFNKHLHNSD